MNIKDTTGGNDYTVCNICPDCGKPYTYIGDIPRNYDISFFVCTCHEKQTDKEFKYCPHCGEQLK